MSAAVAWEAVSAVATSVAALGVIFAFWQVWLTRRIAQMQFEDGMAKEYRELCTKIPAAVFLTKELTDAEYDETFDEFYRYIDLSNEQVSLRKRGRIGKVVWKSWCEGIEYNLHLPAFQRAWSEIKTGTSSFKELRTLEENGFASDPKQWSRLVGGASKERSAK